MYISVKFSTSIDSCNHPNNQDTDGSIVPQKFLHAIPL